MENSSINHFIDYFKLFKVFQLKKIEKTGIVKIIQDKILARKIISVQGNISTNNYIAFQTVNFPNIPFSERYLYVQGLQEAGKAFCMQILFSLGNKQFKAIYSTLYKTAKKHLENIIHLPISMIAAKWNIAVIDMYEIGIQFGFKSQEIKLIFKVNSIEIRASSKVKGIFQSDHLYSIHQMPKQMALPLKKQQNYFEKYHYFVQSTDQECLKFKNQMKQHIEKQRENQFLQINFQTQQQRKQTNKIKQSKSVELKEKNDNKANLSLQKNQKKDDKKKQNLKKIPPIPKKEKGKKNPNTKQQKKPQQIFQEDFEDNEVEQIINVPPKPQGTITLNLTCIQGFSNGSGNLISVESYLCRPQLMPVHRPIQILYQFDPQCIKILTCYNDGSVCLWDAIRKSPIIYFKTQLDIIKQAMMDQQQNIMLIGLDKMKRQVINIIQDSNVIFRQISNYNIINGIFINKQSFQHGILTYGYQNVRLWKVNNTKSIIQGTNIYLGQANRKVKYTSAIIVKTTDDYVAFITDSNGFITTLSISQAKMIHSIKIDNHCLDHIIQLQYNNQNGIGLICNELGLIKILNLQRMQILQEFNLNNRIKQIKQSTSQFSSKDEIIITYYNKSIGSFNLNNSMYTFLMRSHRQKIIKSIYNKYLNKIVTISKDNTIRIWQYVIDSHHHSTLPFRMQEQYQFMITGEEMVDIASPIQGKYDDIKNIVVGGDSGKIRLIDVQSYTIRQEITIQPFPMSLSMSRNGKYILCTYNSGNSYLLDKNLNILSKYLRNDELKQKTKHYKNGFNTHTKQFFLQNAQNESLQFYNIKQSEQIEFTIKYYTQQQSIQYNNTKIFMIGQEQLKIYQKDIIIQRINIKQQGNNINKYIIKYQIIAFIYPLLCFSLHQKLYIKVMLTNLSQFVQLPEQINSITINYEEHKHQGLIICSGKISFSIYVIQFHLNNLQNLQLQLTNLTKYHQQQEQAPQLEISFSNSTISKITHTTHKISQNKSFTSVNRSKISQPPKQLKKLYSQQEQLYQQVKQYLFPKTKQENIIHQQNQQSQDNNLVNQEHYEEQNQTNFSVILHYGYELRQNVLEEAIGKFYWLSENNSLILITGNGKSIIQHFFTVPVKHKILNFATMITSSCMSLHFYEGIRYLCISLNNTIKIYNIHQEITYVRTIQSISSSFPHNLIFQSNITNCNRYLLILSYNHISFDNKLYIHVIQIISGNVVSSSYLSLPQPKNKHKNNQIKEAKLYKMNVNSYKTSLEFIIYHPSGLFYFYRITSVLSLQMLKLQEILPLCRDKIGNLSSACFLSVGQLAYEDSILAIGSQNGSLVFVDCRTANIMIACVELLPNNPIMSISFVKAQHEQKEKLILMSNSTNLTVFNLNQGLNSILCTMQVNQSKISQHDNIKRNMILDAEITSHSNISNESQQIVITKCGTLWLLDYEDFVTVKVSSIHTNSINQAEITLSNNQLYLLSSSDDGTTKLTNLLNLQQTFQIYKPRKPSKSFNIQGQYTLISFQDQIFIYNKLNQQQIDDKLEMISLGSFKLDSVVRCIKNIITTNNYYILTETQLYIIIVVNKLYKKQSFLQSRSKVSSGSISNHLGHHPEVNVEIQKITDIQHPQQVIVNDLFSTYDMFALSSRPGKVTVWMRKCLKRGYNPIEQLANVHDLSYYLIDSQSRNTCNATYVKFINQNEYLWGLYEQSLIQIRNFKEHVTVRQISLSVSKISSIRCDIVDEFIFYIGDENGYISIINQNGLLIQRLKALDSKIKDIQIFKKVKQNKLLVYGSKYIALINNINIKNKHKIQ